MADIYEDEVSGSPVVLPNFQYFGRDSTVTTAGLGTVAGVTLDWYRNMTMIRCRGRFTPGTTTAVGASISLRDGNTNSLSTTQVVGKWWRNVSTGGARKTGTLFSTAGSSAVFFSNDDSATAGDQGTPITGNLVANSGEIIFVDFEIPVTGWELTAYQAYGAGQVTSVKDGLQKATASLGLLRYQGSNGYGSVNTCIRRFTNLIQNTGSVTVTDSATAGTVFTITVSGVYAFTYTDFFSALANLGISKNTTQAATDITSITAADRLVSNASAGANATGMVCWTGYLEAGDLIRAHTNGQVSGSSVVVPTFTIQRLS